MKRMWNITAVLLLAAALRLAGADYKLADGTTVSGELFSPNEAGAFVRGADGKIGERHNWVKFSQDTLKQFAATSEKLKGFVEPFIELPPEALAAAARPKPLDLKPSPRLERPTHVTFASAALTPVGFAMALLLMLANLYAGYEISVFRNRPVPPVVGAAAVLPVIGPLAFLCLPSRVESVVAPQAEPEPEAAPAPAPAEEAAPAMSAEDEAIAAVRAAAMGSRSPAAPEGEDASPPPRSDGAIVEEGEAPSAGLRLAKRDAKTGPVSKDFVEVFKRGEHLINRRFFETKFTGFFRMAPTAAEKDLVLVIRSSRGEYVGSRISRITNDELHLQKRAGDATAETMIPFNDITEVRIRHKDA
ncbi:MAG: hypothetical protein HY301_19855 [Verrucomicrobia bacterium]|nr:hypothetical protein [Verrucomicrobiota bacterium]